MATLLDHRGRPMKAYNSAWDGASSHRQRGAMTFKRSFPYDEDHVVGAYDLDVLRRECLDMRRNNPIVAGVVERFSDHVVGPEGIHPQAKTDSPEWNERAEWYWYEQSKVMDYRQRVNLRELQRLAVQSRLLSGDCGFVLLANGQIQPIEGARILTPCDKRPDSSVVNGVRLSSDGIPVGYFVHSRNASGAITGRNYEYVRKEDMVFVSRPMRFDQVRGLPELSPVLNAIRDFGRLTEETLNKAVLDALHAWAIYSESGASAIANLGQRGYDGDADTDGKIQKYEYFEGGQNYYMGKGEKIESLASNTPNPQYVQFSELILRIIASALCIPYEFLVLDFKQGSFSASRAALMTTYRTFSMWQHWLIDGMLQRLWNWRIAKAIKAGELPPAPQDKATGLSQWYRVQWATPRYDWLDPKAEAIASRDNYLLGVETISSITRAKGRDGEDVLREKAQDIATAARIASDINVKHGLQLTWRDIIEVGNVSLAKSESDKDTEDADEKEEQPSQNNTGNKWLT